MKSKKMTVVVCILTLFLTVSAFVTTEMVAPKKAEASILQFQIDLAAATYKCSMYVVNLTGDAKTLAYLDCMEWNMKAYM